MALANPPPPFAQMPSIFDQGNNGTAASGTIPTVQSLLFLANSGATSTANQLLLTQSAASLSAQSGGTLASNRPPHPPPSFSNLLQGQPQQQPQFKMETPSMEMDANEQQQQIQMAPTIGDGIGLPSPPSSSLSFPPPAANSIGPFSPEYFGLAAAAAQQHHQQQQQQQLVDRRILELLLAKVRSPVPSTGFLLPPPPLPHFSVTQFLSALPHLGLLFYA
jgi:hypothetical protein